MTGDADGMIFWQRGAPRRTLFFHESQRRAQFLRVRFEEFTPVGDGISLGACRQLVDECLHHESIVRVPDRTPPQHGHIHRWMVSRNMEVGNVIVGIGGAFVGGCINTRFYYDGWHWCASGVRLDLD